MGRPSKHRLQSQTTASLRQRDMKLVKLSEESDENEWHGQQPATMMYLARSSMSPGDEPTTVGGLEPKVDTDSKHRLTIGTEEDPSGCLGHRRAVAASDHHCLRTVDTVRNSYVGSSPLSVKTECVDVVTDKLLVVSAGASQLQHVLSGGYCCEMDSKPSSFTGDDFYAVDAKPATVTTLSDDTAMASTSVAASQTTMDVKQATPDVSPGSKWHIAGDRDSPYVSVMALASSYHLFSESCPSSSMADDDGLLSISQQ